MKASPLFAALLVGLFCLSFAPETKAQGSRAIRGYTTIDYDDTSNTITAYSETATDYELGPYYEGFVELKVYKDGVLIASQSNYDGGTGFSSVTLQLSATPGSTYLARGYHNANSYLYDYDDFYPYRIFYYDNWLYSNFESRGVDEPWYYSFLNNGFQQFTRRPQTIKLGATHDEAVVTVGGLKPTSLSVVSISVLPTGWGNDDGCRPDADFGIKVAVRYQVNDQNGNPIQKNNMRPQEKIMNEVLNGVPLGSPVPNWDDVGPSRNSQTSRLTNASGQFVDAPLGASGPGSFTRSADQEISILVGSRRYNVRSHHLTFTSSAQGAGTISNGSDLQRSRP